MILNKLKSHLSRRNFLRIAVVLLLAIAAGYLSQILNPKESLERLFSFIDSLGLWGPALLAVCQFLVTLLLIPGPLFSLGAGFLFGITGGVLTSISGTMAGSLGAFLIARNFFSPALANRLLNHPRFRLLKLGLTDQGWKFVMSTRLFPFFPFKLSNYFFGLTPISFKSFVLGNFLGIIPYQLLAVYTGSMLSSLADLRNPQVLRSPVNLTIYSLGFIFCIFMIFYITRQAKRSLAVLLENEALAQSDADNGPDVSIAPL